MVVLRKRHQQGGDRCDRKRCQVRACAGAQKRDLARSRMTMIRPLPGSADGGLGIEDETGPCDGVKGAVDAYDPPLEARVPRLDRCCLKQKVGYSRDAAPKNHRWEYRRNCSRARGSSKSYKNLFSRSSFCLNPDSSLFLRDSRVIGCSGLFRSLCFPLGISVEDHVLEIAGVDSGSGLTMGDFTFQKSPQPLLCRETVDTHPFLLRKFSVW